jgi:hypothetical protein
VELYSTEPRLEKDELKYLYFDTFKRDVKYLEICISQSLTGYTIYRGNPWKFFIVEEKPDFKELFSDDYKCILFKKSPVGNPIDIAICLPGDVILMNVTTTPFAKSVIGSLQKDLKKQFYCVNVANDQKTRKGFHFINDINYLDRFTIEKLSKLHQCSVRAKSGARCKNTVSSTSICWQHRQ